jgi:hypothetical protein
MPQDWWSWTDTGVLVPLGICEDFNAADEKAPGNSHWLFNRDTLTEFKQEIERELQ